MSTIHTKATPVRVTGNMEPMFSQVHPCVVTKAPDANEVTAMVANTKKLIAA